MGGPFTLAAIYLTIWWTVLFAVLPLGTQTRAEAGLPNDGTDPGAPVDPKLKKKFITTTWVSSVVFAILWLVIASLCVGVTVVLLFVEDLAGINLKPLVSTIFVAALALLIGALLLFLRETREATAALRIPETYLELERKL